MFAELGVWAENRGHVMMIDASKAESSQELLQRDVC